MYDLIVIGAGGVGSAILSHAARRGMRVLGLDRFAGGHDRGSSHGETRIIRQAYFEHPDYVPLAKRAYELWAELEEDCGEKLFFETGLLQVGPAEGEVVAGVRRSAEQHGLEIDNFTAAEATRQFPQFTIHPDCSAVYEPKAGYLRVERCVLAHLAQAEKHGAELRDDCEVRGWDAGPFSIEVHLNNETIHTTKIVVAAGAWAGQLLGGMGANLRVLRKPLHWFAVGDDRYQRDSGCPAFLFETPTGVFYGFPQIDSQGVKAAQHSGGREIHDPLNESREIDEEEQQQVAQFITSTLPGATGETTGHSVCFYTMTPDQHFLIGRAPGSENVFVAAGLSGHGFKFTSVLGEALADLMIEGKTSLPISFLDANRL